jgi:hypothetical protein
MSLVLADRVLETSATTGTGSFTLAGPVTGFQSFNTAIGNGNTTYYTIECPATGEWEVGLGTFTSPSTLARTQVYSSSNAGSAVNFSAGGKNVFVDMSATKWSGGKLALANGGTNADLSSTGGTSQVLQQSSAGAAITVGQLSASNLSNGTTGSGSVVLSTSPTLTTPNFSSIVNTGTLTLPTSTDTLVGRATSDTLTNKSISGSTNTLTNIGNSSLTNSSVTINGSSVSLGGSVTVTAAASSITVGTTTVGSGTSGYILYNNGGTLGNLSTTGTAGSVVLSASPTLSGTVGGALTFSGALTLSSALTYGGVTLSNSVTGTGSMVLSASPTLTGTLTVTSAAVYGFPLVVSKGAYGGGIRITTTTSNNSEFQMYDTTAGGFGFFADSAASGRFNLYGVSSGGAYVATWLTASASGMTLPNALTYGGVTLANSVTGTGSMVLSTSPSFGGTVVFSSMTGSNLYTTAGVMQMSRDSSTGGGLLFIDSAAGGQNWQAGPGSGTGNKDYWGLYNFGTTTTVLNIGKTGDVNAGSSFVAPYFSASSAYQFSGANVLLRTSGYTVLYDGSTRQNLFLGNTSDPTNYYRNTTHFFQTVGGAANILSMTGTLATFAVPLNYGGVTLANSVTGTGSMVLSASPTLTGTLVTSHTQATGTGNDFYNCGFETIGNGVTNTVYPGVGFHQPGVFASSIQLRGGGDFRFYSQGAASYANITAAAGTFTSTLTSNSYVYSNTGTGAMARFVLQNTNRSWSISNYGTTYTPNGAFVIADETAGAVRMTIDTSGNFIFGSATLAAPSTAAPLAMARCWVNFNGSSGAVTSSLNVSSVTRSGSGLYTVNMTTAAPNTTYARFASAYGGPGVFSGVDWSGASTSAFNVYTANTVTQAYQDANPVYALAFW